MNPIEMRENCDKLAPMINAIRFICGCIREMVILLKPSGAEAIAAENIVPGQQLITLPRQHKRSPKLSTYDFKINWYHSNAIITITLSPRN